MNRFTNPFAPGAGTPPPELAGREQILEDANIVLARIKAGRSSKSQMLLGLRGVGKTVLLNRLDEMAGQAGYQTMILESPEDRQLAEMLVPKLRSLLIKLSRIEQAKDLAKQGLSILRRFANVFKVSVGDMEFGVQPADGTADSGNLELDLPDLLLAVASVAQASKTGVALFIDEVQDLSSTDLAALLASIHRLGQKGLPFVFFGAGLPQLAALAGGAKSYAERLLDYPEVGSLSEADAENAIRSPLRQKNVEIQTDALQLIVAKTKGYPYFLQEWGAHTWDAATSSPIIIQDVERASVKALQRLDSGFFRVRLDRLTPREKDYMRAMAELGAGPHRSGDIAKKFGVQTTAATIRNDLIKKGMVFSLQHGDTSFTVPMFDEFMKRSIPDWLPRASAAPNDKPPRIFGLWRD